MAQATPEPIRAATPAILEASLVGQVHAVINCTSTGISWSGHTQGFLANTRITYEWKIYKDGSLWYTNEHGGYYTDGVGYHWRLPSGFPQAIDCDAGEYEIYMYVRNDDDTYETFTGHDSTICT